MKIRETIEVAYFYYEQYIQQKQPVNRIGLQSTTQFLINDNPLWAVHVYAKISFQLKQ